MLVLVEFFILSIGGLFFETIDLYSEEYNYIFGTLAKLSEMLLVLCVRRIWKSPNNFHTLKRMVYVNQHTAIFHCRCCRNVSVIQWR